MTGNLSGRSKNGGAAVLENPGQSGLLAKASNRLEGGRQSEKLAKKRKGSYFSYFLMFNFYYLAWALFSALISVYLIGLGFSAGQASLVVSVSFFASMVTQPMVGSLADQYGSKSVSIVMFITAASGGVVFLFCRSLWMVTIFYSVVMVLVNGTNPVVEKMATTSPYPYGKIRIWGTIGYAFGTQAAGFLYDVVSPSSIFVAFVLCMMICILGTSQTIEPTTFQNSAQTKADMQEVAEVQEEIQAEETKNTKGFAKLFTNRKFAYYLLVYGLFMGVLAAGNTFVPSLFTHNGLPAATASTFLSIAVLCEMPLVFFSSKFMDQLTSKVLLLFAIILVLGQMLVYGLNLPMPVVVGVTMLTKNVSSMLMIMVNLKIVSSLIPSASQISALALAATIKNLASILFNNFAGVLIDNIGYSPAFLLMAGAMILVLVLVVFFRLPSGTDQKLFS